MFKRTLHDGVVVCTVASQQEGPWFESQLGAFCVLMHCFACYLRKGYILILAHVVHRLCS